MVVADYLRHFGQEGVAGVHFVSAITESGSPEAMGLLGPEFLQLLPGFLTQDVATSLATLSAFVGLLYNQPLSEEMASAVLGYNTAVPAHVREGIATRVEDHREALGKLSVPVMVTHGLEDKVILPEASRRLAAAVPQAEVSLYEGVGHSPFWEDAARFDRELAGFAARCA
jgi:pimeloyl-ACP methyl ester carboxylesterase